ncbi:hypothetical protein VTN77DRAFT_4733 [Rasamsonia byssochlamydoides]|uniref:uncharacterized protein n=1 Tax=Rasamsonia byssochlamydoides TaxID=89139 RepID=UPI0037435ED4
MRWFRLSSLVAAAFSCLPLASATQFLESDSLDPCIADSLITATLFNVVFTPNNNTLQYDIIANSTITGNVTVALEVIAYGYTAATIDIDPCNSALSTNFCPIQDIGPIRMVASTPVPDDIASKIPGIAYTIPDLDGIVRIYINSTDQHRTVACVEAQLSNGKTVYQKAVGWTLAVIAGLALTASAIASGLGFSNAAAHVAANALSLFGFFQAQAMFGMASVTMPPIVEAWTQNFQWSMGIIRVGFLQSLSTWYQRSTGGTPSTVLSSLSQMSVTVQKRSVEFFHDVAKRTSAHLVARDDTSALDGTSTTVVRGIDRVGFVANIEETNIFMTGLIFFALFVMLMILLIVLFKLYTKLAVKHGWMSHGAFQDFRNGWTSVMRGILFRLILIGYPQMVVLCLWELTRRDSVAEAILAAIMFASMTGVLAWAALKVIRLAKRSVMMHKNPAYILYSNPKFLHTWGFLYVQYRASAYYWVFPALIYILVKGAFIGLAQQASVVQAVALVIIELAALIAAAVFRPWMDRKTNTFNIAILVVHFINAIFLLMFTSVFNQPAMVNGVMGVVFAIYNAAFALVLLIMVLVSAIYAIFSKNPDLRYEPVRDDRGSFIRSQTYLKTTELDALGATARGETKVRYGLD